MSANELVTDLIRKTAKQYNCSLPVIKNNIYTPGIFSYQMSRFVIDSYGDDDENPHHYIFAKDLPRQAPGRKSHSDIGIPFIDKYLQKLKL